MTDTSIQQRPPRPRTDYRDLTIAELLVCEAELQARIADLTGERDTYRQMTQMAIGKVAERDRIIARQERQRIALLAEYRAFRVLAMARSLPTVDSEQPTRRRVPTHLLKHRAMPAARPQA